MQVTTRYQPLAPDASRRRADQAIAWLRSYGERRINSRLMDERRSIPPSVVLDMGAAGLFGLQVEERFGGLALRSRDVARVLEQTAAIDLGLGTFLLTSLFPGVRPIAAFGSAALRDELLRDLATGRALAGYAQTERGAGTHFAALTARAVVGGSGWRLSGDKVWIGNSSWARVLTAMAHGVDERGRKRGLTAFAVRTDRPGVVVGREILSMGMRGMVQGEIGFRDVAVGPDDVVGELERGLEVGVDSMSWSRFAIAATCIGAMKRCAQLLHRFAGRRAIATGPLLDHPVTRGALGEITAGVAAAEGLLHFVADRLDRGAGVGPELLAACKSSASELLWCAADRLLQLLGSRGYDEANPAAQLLRDARVTRIFEGATEALRAFLGAEAMAPTSGLAALITEELKAPDVADTLQRTLARLRERELPAGAGSGRATQRAWEAGLAGEVAEWALLAASAQRSGNAHAVDWAAARLREAAARAAGEAEPAAPLLAASEAQKAIDVYAGEIGDVEQQLPGNREERDPLLSRDAPSA
jgi:alkylation response protein AidB-like acyl-CoA dehydrogenase